MGGGFRGQCRGAPGNGGETTAVGQLAGSCCGVQGLEIRGRKSGKVRGSIIRW